MVSEEKSFESVDGRRTDHGGLPYYKLPRSLRLRGAKKWTGMHFASSTRAAEDRTRWKGIVAKSSVVSQQPCNVMGETRLDLVKM